MIGISPRQLEVFATIAATGSVRAAADCLHLTQPAASMALAGLERRIGVKLFDRVSQRLHLNECGRNLLPLAQDTLRQLQEIENVSHFAEGQELCGDLHVGASNTVGSYRVRELLGDFVSAHPAVGICLAVDNTKHILGKLLDYSLDVGCVEGPVMQVGMDVLPWREDRLVVCVRPDHPLAHKTPLQPADFADVRWILREHGSATRALVEHELTRLPTGVNVLELGHSEAIKQAVIAGLGLACLPKVAVRDALAVGDIVCLDTPFLDLQRSLSLVLVQGRYRGALIEAFLSSALNAEVAG